MGYLRQHAIIVTGHYDDHIDKAHAKALELFDPEVIQPVVAQVGSSLVTPILVAPVNGTRSFAVLPDGSKEGWGTSDNGDGARKAFVAYLRAQAYDDGSTPLDWVEVQYGDDDKRTRTLRSSDTDTLRNRRNREDV